MLLFDVGETEAQEWSIVQRAVRESKEREPDTWVALLQCPAIEVYTDGSAPIRNPGGDAGFAAIVVGFSGRISKATSVRPDPIARLNLGGYIPQRKSLPLTSNNRAEMAGIMAAQEALRHLTLMGWSGNQAVIWSDSKYAILCATGAWKRKKNTDLWPIYDRLAAEVQRAVPAGVTLEWVKGHAGNLYNDAADAVATEAAFNFDETRYDRFRAAQAATGREMPGESAFLSDDGSGQTGKSGAAAQALSVGTPQQGGWLNGADYALVLSTRMDAKQQGAGTGIGTGTYRIWSGDGQSREGSVRHKGQMLHDEAEYHTLIAALSGIVAGITTGSRDPGEYVLTVYSARELMVKQLKGEYKVKAPALQAPYTDARNLLRRFKRIEFFWKRGPELMAMLNEAPLA